MGAQITRAKPDAKSANVSKAQVEPTRVSQTAAVDYQQPKHISARLQGGSPLPLTTRERMERSFGRSFRDVQVHTGATAKDITQAQTADALTVGQKIAFAPGQFRPGTQSGDHLIAHELAHVVQQGGGGGSLAAQAHSHTSSPSESAEVAADRAADRVMQGKPVGLLPTGLSTRGRIMRRIRRGASSLPAMTVATPVPGFGRKGDAARSVPSAVTTGLLSPAGNQLPATVGDSPARTASKPKQREQPQEVPEIKEPDETQTAIAKEEGPPPTVAVAGASAGATAADVAGVRAKPKAEKAAKKTADKKKEKDKEKLDEQEKEQEKDKEAAKEEAGEKKAKKKRKFGQITGDRGAGAARAAVERLNERAGAMEHHEPAGQRISEARAAAEPPANEGQSRAQGQQVDTVAEADVPPAEPEAARQDMRRAVEAAAPANMEEMDRMGSDAGSQRIRTALTGAITGQVQGVRGTLDAVNNPSPAEAPVPAVPQPEPEPAPDTPAPNLSAAAPPAVPDESLDASEFREEAEENLAAHDIDDETLAKANEGPLSTVAQDKQSLDEAVEQAASNARSAEGPALAEATSALETEEGTAQGEMTTTREGQQQQVLNEQETTRTGEEGGRQTVSDQIEGIYNRAAEEVNTKLDGLTEAATQEFDQKQQEYLDEFNSTTRSELDDFKDRRYSGALGWGRWLKDRFVSINELSEVKGIYQRNRDRYIERIDLLISQITGNIDNTITECKQILESARTEIQELVDNLPANLQEEARAAQERVEQQFAQLENRINQAAEAAKNALQQRREQAIEAVDRALAEIQAENEALLDKIANFVNQLAEALGKFMRLMTRITRMGIGSFIGAALAQAKEGVKNHLWDALKEAFKQWLFSKLPFLEPLLNLPPNWPDMLAAMVTSLPDLFRQNLPEMLPGIAIAAMTWLAINLAAKLIPGAGAIMAVIDGLRAAWGLVQNLFSAAEAFFAFVMKVAQPVFAAVDFANALARGIVAGLAAILTFLGVDRLIMRVGGAVVRPFGRIFSQLSQRFRGRRQRQRQQREQEQERDQRETRRQEREDNVSGNAVQRRQQQDRDRRRQERDQERTRRENDRRRQIHRNRQPDRSRRRDRDRDTQRDERRQENERNERRRRDRERRRVAIRETRHTLTRLLRANAGFLRIQAAVLRLRLRYRWHSLSARKRGGHLEVKGSLSPTFQVIDADQSYEIVRVSGINPLNERDWEEFESEAVQLASSVILPAQIPEGIETTQSGLRRRGSQVRRLRIPQAGDPARLYREPIVQDPSHRLTGASRTPSAFGRKGERTGTVAPELLAVRRDEVIPVEATMRSDWDLSEVGLSSEERGQRIRKRAQFAAFIFNLAQAVPIIHRSRMTIRIMFIAPDKPSDATIRDLQQDFQQHAAGMNVRIQWLIVPVA